MYKQGIAYTSISQHSSPYGLIAYSTSRTYTSIILNLILPALNISHNISGISFPTRSCSCLVVGRYTIIKRYSLTVRSNRNCTSSQHGHTHTLALNPCGLKQLNIIIKYALSKNIHISRRTILNRHI